jgi:hypothetical protein
MINLLKETLSAIERSGHTVKDIAFIGSQTGDYACTWAEFEKLADKEYDNGYGGQEVACDLIILFTDGTEMWRHEYDGSERWTWREKFSPCANPRLIHTLIMIPDSEHHGWMTIHELNS